MISFLVLLLGISSQSLKAVASTDLSGPSSFNLAYTGVVFGPYVKNRFPNGTSPNWKSYSDEEISALLKVASTKFKHITTYGMGVGDPNGHWSDGDGTGLVPFLSAVHNSKQSNRKLSVSIGVWHYESEKLYQREVFNAFEAAREANAKYENTVWGIALSSFAFFGPRNDQILQFLESNRPQARQYRLKIGVRIDFCDQIIQTKLPQEEYIKGLHSAVGVHPEDQPLSDIQKIARAADFLICIAHPPANLVSQGVKVAAESMMAKMNLIQKLMKKENEVIDLWFETGWPSAGISRSGSKNTARNLRTYWNLMSQLGTKFKIHLYMFTAFDEPWKINPKANITDPHGPNGAESHYGWWRLLDNNDFSKFEEKGVGPQLRLRPLKYVEFY